MTTASVTTAALMMMMATTVTIHTHTKQCDGDQSNDVSNNNDNAINNNCTISDD